jgi:hypothetical protein
MDCLQEDAAKQYELVRKPLKRRDSFRTDRSDSSAGEETTLLREKNGAYFGAAMPGDESSRWQSTKAYITSFKDWTQAKSSGLKINSHSITGLQGSVRQRNVDDQEAVEMQLGSTRGEYLMLGMSGSKIHDRLIQVYLPNPPANDAEFFRILRTNYQTYHRRWYGMPRFWKYLGGVYFVKFRMEVATESHTIIRIDTIDAMPDVGDTQWTRIMSEHKPPTPQYLVNAVNDPDGFQNQRRKGLDVFLEIPRKLDDPMPERPGQTGWGLYFFECNSWFNIGIGLLILEVLIFTIAWSSSARQ